MAIDQVIGALLRVPLFAGLTPLQITEIGRRAQRRAFGRGEAIVTAGEAGDGAYLILSGEATSRPPPGTRGRPEPIEPGSVVGELAMLVDHVYGTTVMAHGWVDCLKLERIVMHAQMREDPDMAKRLAQAIRDRLARVAAELQMIDDLLVAAGGQREAAQRRLPPPSARQPALRH